MEDFIEKAKKDRYWVVLLASSVALIVAYFSEYFLGFIPCSLCLLQRIPYAILILIAISHILKPRRKKIHCLLIILLCLIEVGLATYHVGIEHYIFKEAAVCQFNFDLKQASNCSQVHFKFMNFSMAEWNLIYILALLYYFIRKDNGIWKA